LLGRPDLDLALTKLHLFRLGSAFSTIVYLDADTLPLRRLDQLFALTEGHAFSASPDIGWPDCFNSGVMVIRPNDADFDGLRTMMTESAEHNGSFDGADQGLLNNYFSEDGPGGQWNRLPFT
jgi:alpha-N-acetylglucosamine transferase